MCKVYKKNVINYLVSHAMFFHRFNTESTSEIESKLSPKGHSTDYVKAR